MFHVWQYILHFLHCELLLGILNKRQVWGACLADSDQLPCVWQIFVLDAHPHILSGKPQESADS